MNVNQDMFAGINYNTMLNIKEQDGKKYVQLTELYEKLELNPANYAKFIRDQIRGNAYAIEGQQYSYLGMKTGNKGGRPKDDYLLTVDFAKDLILLSKSREGKRFRDWLIDISKQVENKELLSESQIIYLVKLKEVFKYLCYQADIESLHQKKYVENSNTLSPYADFHVWRNQMLNLEPKILERRLKEYCIENSRFTKAKTKKDKLILLDKYETIRNAVWDFMELKGEVNSMRLANLVKRMAEAENTQLFRNNEDNLFHQKESIQIPSVLTKKITQ